MAAARKKNQYNFNIIYNRTHGRTDFVSVFVEFIAELLEQEIGKDGHQVVGYYAERDMLPGRNLFDENFRVIKNSDYTIAVLDKGFITKPWTMYWNQASFRELIEQGPGLHGNQRFIPISLNLEPEAIEKTCQHLSCNEVIYFKNDYEFDERNKRRLVRVIKDGIPMSDDEIRFVPEILENRGPSNQNPTDSEMDEPKVVAVPEPYCATQPYLDVRPRTIHQIESRTDSVDTYNTDGDRSFRANYDNLLSLVKDNTSHKPHTSLSMESSIDLQRGKASLREQPYKPLSSVSLEATIDLRRDTASLPEQPIQPESLQSHGSSIPIQRTNSQSGAVIGSEDKAIEGPETVFTSIATVRGDAEAQLDDVVPQVKTQTRRVTSEAKVTAYTYTETHLAHPADVGQTTHLAHPADVGQTTHLAHPADDDQTTHSSEPHISTSSSVGKTATENEDTEDDKRLLFDREIMDDGPVGRMPTEHEETEDDNLILHDRVNMDDNTATQVTTTSRQSSCQSYTESVRSNSINFTSHQSGRSLMAAPPVQENVMTVEETLMAHSNVEWRPCDSCDEQEEETTPKQIAHECINQSLLTPSCGTDVHICSAYKSSTHRVSNTTKEHYNQSSTTHSSTASTLKSSVAESRLGSHTALESSVDEPPRRLHAALESNVDGPRLSSHFALESSVDEPRMSSHTTLESSSCSRDVETKNNSRCMCDSVTSDGRRAMVDHPSQNSEQHLEKWHVGGGGVDANLNVTHGACNIHPDETRLKIPEHVCQATSRASVDDRDDRRHIRAEFHFSYSTQVLRKVWQWVDDLASYYGG